MNATYTPAVATVTATFRKTPYGLIARTEADSALVKLALPPKFVARNEHIMFPEDHLGFVVERANGLGIVIDIEQEARESNDWLLEKVA